METIHVLVGFTLFMSGYLLKRVDRADENLIDHERKCNK